MLKNTTQYDIIGNINCELLEDRGLKKMKRLNNAFTLTELLVALGVISILCAVLLPVIFNVMPNQNIIMAKRAYYTLQTVISDMLNDESCYPDRTSDSENPRIGLDDGFGYINCTPWGQDKISTENSKTKFLYVFKDKLGILQNDAAKDDLEVFTTSDGISWAVHDFNLSQGQDNGGSVTITVDVNGLEEKSAPNCAGNGYSYVAALGTGTDASCKNRTNGYDRFQVVIKGNGQMNINPNETWAINAVKVNRNITSDKNSNEEDDI